MTTAALVTMIVTWIVIAYFTVRFFLKVLRTPQEKD
jgi:uncharacterized membrane protein YwzB